VSHRDTKAANTRALVDGAPKACNPHKSACWGTPRPIEIFE
jgi:hypothetical protein